MENDIKLRYVTVEYLDALFKQASKICPSAGNKSRELISMAMKDAVFEGFINYNPVPETKPYKRKKPKIRILSKEKIKVLLNAASKKSMVSGNNVRAFLWTEKGRNFRTEI